MYKVENATLLNIINSGAEGAWGSKRKSFYSTIIGQTVLRVVAIII